MHTLAEVHRALRDAADPAIAAHSKRFFKTEPGGYGEGDRFYGIRVPVVKKSKAARDDLVIAYQELGRADEADKFRNEAD